MKVLLILPNSARAQRAGMNVTGAHPIAPNVEFHWPELGCDRLRGKQYDVVIVDTGTYCDHFLEEARAILNRGKTVWIEP